MFREIERPSDQVIYGECSRSSLRSLSAILVPVDDHADCRKSLLERRRFLSLNASHRNTFSSVCCGIIGGTSYQLRIGASAQPP